MAPHNWLYVEWWVVMADGKYVARRCRAFGRANMEDRGAMEDGAGEEPGAIKLVRVVICDQTPRGASRRRRSAA